MGKQLVLAEKPSVGRELARVLGCKRGGEGYLEGDRYVVTWALGHLVTLADPDVYEKKWEKWDMADLPMLPQHRKLVVIPQTARQFRVVQSLMKRSDITGLIIATDAGREGELVARWIMAKAGWNKPAKRLWISRTAFGGHPDPGLRYLGLHIRSGHGIYAPAAPVILYETDGCDGGGEASYHLMRL